MHRLTLVRRKRTDSWALENTSQSEESFKQIRWDCLWLVSIMEATERSTLTLKLVWKQRFAFSRFNEKKMFYGLSALGGFVDFGLLYLKAFLVIFEYQKSRQVCSQLQVNKDPIEVTQGSVATSEECESGHLERWPEER